MGFLVIADSRNRGHWLDVRNDLVTASEAWMMILPGKDGEDPRELLISQKVSRSQPDENEPMRWGRRLERPIFDGLCLEDPICTWGVTPFGLLVRDPECEDLAATPDALAYTHTPGHVLPMQVKSGGFPWTVTKEMKSDAIKAGVPIESLSPIKEYVQIQMQVEMACTASPRALLGRLHAAKGLAHDFYVVDRHQPIIDRLRNEARSVMAEVRARRGGR